METSMTISANRVVLVAAGEVQDRREFFFGFAIDAPDHLAVLVDGMPADPRPEIAAWPNAIGGTVTFAEPLSEGAVLVLERIEPIARARDISATSGVSAGQINAELDSILRHLAGLAGRARQRLAVSLAVGSDCDVTLPGPGTRAGRALGFDGAGLLALRSRADQRGFAGDVGPIGLPGAMRGSNNLAELSDTAQARSVLNLPARAALEDALADRRRRVERIGFNLVANAFRDAARRDMARMSLVDGVLDLLADTEGIDFSLSSGISHDAMGHVLSNEIGGGAGQAFTLQSLPMEQEETPNAAYLLFLTDPVDAPSEPDDLALSVSRTGGLDWTALPAPIYLPFSNTMHLLASGSVSLSEQPDGNALVWRISSAAMTRRRFHGWALLWS